MKKSFLFIALFIAMLLLTSCPMDVEPNPVEQNPVITWADSVFGVAARTSLDKAADASVTSSEAASITELDLSGKQLSKLDDIKHFPALITLNLSNNKITNISALSALTSLTTLDLSNNTITSIDALSDLTQLVTLKLIGNNDIPTGTWEDWLSFNHVTNVDIRPEQSIYEITLPENLIRLAEQGEDENFAGKTIKFMNDIDMTGFEFAGIPRFAGLMDGNGKKIINLTIKRPNDQYVGLVNYLEGGEIKNLTIESGTIIGHDHVGAFVGVARGGNSPETSTIPKLNGLTNKASVSGIVIVGGIIGAAPNGGTPNSIIENVTNTGNISGTSTSIGGIVGQLSYASVTNATNSGTVSGDGKVGGIIGWAEAVNLQTANNSGSISVEYGRGTSVGGIIGTAEGYSFAMEIANVTNTGSITIKGQPYSERDNLNNTYLYFISAGGIIGEAMEEMKMTNAKNTGNVTADAVAGLAGGIIGFSFVTESAMLIEGAENTGAVEVIGNSRVSGSGDDKVSYRSAAGGIIGKITKTQLVASTTSRQSLIFEGSDRNSTMPTNTFMNARTAPTKKILINKIMNSGKVTTSGNDSASGGIVGETAGNTQEAVNITNAGNIGEIHANTENNTSAGGIIGYNFIADMSNVYNYGTISTGTYRGALIGVLMQTATVDGYALNTTIFAGADPKNLGFKGGTRTRLTNEQFKNQTSFTDWDFTKIWQMSTDYPTLQP